MSRAGAALRSIAARWRLGEPPDEDRAWACLVANLLATPGLGTLMAGRRSGYAQALLALFGFVLTMAWFADFFGLWIRSGLFPIGGGPRFGLGLAGAGLFAASWLWAAVSSLSILRAARKGLAPGERPSADERRERTGRPER